jgi:KDO2-lipid IV(A) lauroyltransferase
MQALFFYLFYGFSWLIARLPSRVIYILSDLVAFFLYHITQYRRDVVRKNLTNSFPHKPLIEIVTIEKRFYKHFTDLFFESIIITHASKNRVLKMCKFVNPEILDPFYQQRKSVILALGHYGNWELMSLIGVHIKHIALGIYKPLVDKRFERMINNSRKRFGGVPVSMQDAFRTTISRVRAGDVVLVGLISDQTPASGEIRYWTQFLNQDTPVFLGVEKISEKLDCPVLFSRMDKVSRGRYQVTFSILCTEPKAFAPYEITNMHVRALEEQIKECPEYWLWSHRRWKRKRNIENES